MAYSFNLMVSTSRQLIRFKIKNCEYCALRLELFFIAIIKGMITKLFSAKRTWQNILTTTGERKGVIFITHKKKRQINLPWKLNHRKGKFSPNHD